ncbi:MAG: mannosyltransferase family protein [Acidimicrobiales bacterium]
MTTWVDTTPETRWRTGAWIAVSRIVAGILVGHAVVTLFPQSMLHSRLGTLGDGTWLGVFDRWDARYYTGIAAHGYPTGTTEVPAFFPGYPLVIRLVHELAGGALSYAQAGCLVSFAAFTAAAGLLYRLVAARFGTRAALVSTVLFCWFPTSVFYLAPYTEALFALEILAVAILVERGRWWWAALVAGYASATSPESVALTAALVVAAALAGRGIRRTLGYAVVGSLGAAAYVAYLGIRLGNPLAFAGAEPRFHRVVLPPFVAVVENLVAIPRTLHADHVYTGTLRSLSSNVVWMWILDDLTVVLATIALVYLVVLVVRDRREPGTSIGGRVPIAWLVVLGGVAAIASSTALRTRGAPVSTEGDARFVSVAFPLYPGLYLLVRRWQAPIVIGLGLSVAAAVVTQALFNLGYWVT